MPVIVRSGFTPPSRVQSAKGGQVSVLDRDGQFSKYSRYSCGWPFQSALTLSPIECFETTSKYNLKCHTSPIDTHEAAVC